MKKKAIFNWSGGKDSALALKKALDSKKWDIIALLTTINSEKEKVTMHNIPISLLQAQADSIGIPLRIVKLPSKCGMSTYNTIMKEVVLSYINEVDTFIFGDIFLEEVRQHREKQLTPFGIKVEEPLWGMTTSEVINEFLDSGLQSVITTTTASILDEQFLGQVISNNLISTFPKECDLCGENGEYHSFCFDGPIFKKPIKFKLGEHYKYTTNIKLEDGTNKEYTYWSLELKKS